ncbi:MAG: hypothetical protein KKE02_03565 [Alphaproteobacteria bacterium]|nr:hypothetical protein [Alphaproteobacteria bacterium]MBU1514391.1 hypothetical protein [Alphaproteobacteria bacterium]MBU2096035.1 hypothetical protein [Alphaproteobacteria bacterium]MBU2150077.1 hypothetical protein [Alphaproteobacteria bacterium]MBU2308590.1 hypothetical protein [Alphaproteobacteria bacterium]
MDLSDPRTEVAHAHHLLANGAWREGLAHYEARYRLPGLTSPVGGGVPEWRGEPLAGRHILVTHEQGHGDQISFARFLAPLRTAGAGRITLTCAVSLARLFGQLEAVDDVIPIGVAQHKVIDPPDLWIRGGSLPLRLGLAEAEIPAAPYLMAAPRPQAVRVGVVTNGNPDFADDHHRSLPPALAAEVRALRGVMSLAPDATGAGDFLDTAEIVAGLDLVITTCTAVAHLAGAMGKPTWVMLSAVRPDWRWTATGTRTPWYPSATLYRQPAPGDWRSVLDRIAADLAVISAT